MSDAKAQQARGFYRRQIGDALVTTVNDGFLDIPMDILRGAGRGDMEALMDGAFQPRAPRLTVNAFVIQTVAIQISSTSEAGRRPSIRWARC